MLQQLLQKQQLVQLLAPAPAAAGVASGLQLLQLLVSLQQ